LGIGDWGLGIGDWGLGIGGWGRCPQPPTPIPKTQIPNPPYNSIYNKKCKNLIFNFKFIKNI